MRPRPRFRERPPPKLELGLGPFGEFAEQAQLELIYARYMTYDLEGARSSADRFIRLHPGHDSVDYAYYLKGLSAYRESNNLLDSLLSQDPARRLSLIHI